MINNDYSYLTTQGPIGGNIQETIPEYSIKKGRKSRTKTKALNKTTDSSVSTLKPLKLAAATGHYHPQTFIDDLMERYGRGPPSQSGTKFVKLRKSVDKRRKSVENLNQSCGNCGN